MLTVLQSLLCALGALTLLWAIWGLFLCPLGADGSVLVTIRLQGDAAGLEHSLRALRWLRESGLLTAEVHLEDGGLTAEGRERLRRAAQTMGTAGTVSGASHRFRLICPRSDYHQT